MLCIKCSDCEILVLIPKYTLIHKHIKHGHQFKVSTSHSSIGVILVLSVFSPPASACLAVKVAVLEIWAVRSDGTAGVVNNLLRRALCRRVTNVCQRNGPAEVRAGLLTSSHSAQTPRSWRRESLMIQVSFFFCVQPPLSVSKSPNPAHHPCTVQNLLSELSSPCCLFPFLQGGMVKYLTDLQWLVEFNFIDPACNF